MSPLLPPSQTIQARQIWALATAAAQAAVSDCYAYRIHRGGSIVINNTTTIDLVEDAFLRPPCDAEDDPGVVRQILDNAILDVKDPYFPNTSPVLFVLAICLTIAWVLLIMLMITPRTFFHGGPGYGVGQMRTATSGGSIPIVGIGMRPWFQKVATATVAASLLVATVRTFDIAADQYDQGYQDSLMLTWKTMDSTEVRVVRYISTTFEWLAQAQTSLRLFQRHREKVVIKWVALSLIGLEMIFGILNNFTPLKQNDEDIGRLRPRRYSNAIPALQYLFEMALSLMYAAVVFYYSLTKRRFAYYHPKMKNISLVALLSSLAVLVPVIFFILDIAVPNVAVWGDYVRWVGAAAASVIVWEWVERIEALERDERKDGILGREIFEGDEMLDNGPGPHGAYKSKKRRLDKTDSSTTTIVASSRDSGSSSLKRRFSGPNPKFPRLDRGILAKIAALRRAKKTKADTKPSHLDDKDVVELSPAPRAIHRRQKDRVERHGAKASSTDAAVQPPQVAPSPISRSDCTSASTVYRVVHHPISPTSTPGISETLYPQGNAMNLASPSPDNTRGKKRLSDLGPQKAINMANLNPFRNRGNAHTPETLETVSDDEEHDEGGTRQDSTRKNKKQGRSGFFAKLRRNPSEEMELPPLVIPWRGDDAADTQQFDLESGLATGSSRMHRENSNNSTSSRKTSNANASIWRGDAHADYYSSSSPYDDYMPPPRRDTVSTISRDSPSQPDFPGGRSSRGTPTAPGTSRATHR